MLFARILDTNPADATISEGYLNKVDAQATTQLQAQLSLPNQGETKHHVIPQELRQRVTNCAEANLQFEEVQRQSLSPMEVPLRSPPGLLVVCLILWTICFACLSPVVRFPLAELAPSPCALRRT